MCTILDAKIWKGRLFLEIQCQNLMEDQHKYILKLLLGSKYLFNSTMGTWNMEPEEFE